MLSFNFNLSSTLDLYLEPSPPPLFSLRSQVKKNCIFSEKKSIHNDSLNIYDQVELILYLELDPLPSTSPLDLYIVLSPLTSTSTSAST